MLLVLSAAETQECSEQLDALNEPASDDIDTMQVNLLQTYLEPTQARIAPQNGISRTTENHTVRHGNATLDKLPRSGTAKTTTNRTVLHGNSTLAELALLADNVSHDAPGFAYSSLSLPQLIYHQIEFETRIEVTMPAQKNKIVFAILEGLTLPGILGIDRCYMGQPLLGVLKGFTCGGFFLWWMIDYACVCVNMLKQDTSINYVGFQATFPSDQVKPALVLMVVFMSMKLFTVMCFSRSPKK